MDKKTTTYLVKEIKKNIKAWCIRLATTLLVAIPICFMTVIGLLHLPVVQQKLLHRLLNQINKTTPYKIKCDNIQLTWLQHITLSGIEAIDPQQQHLFHVHQLHCKIKPFSLLLLKPDIVDTCTISNGKFFLEEDSNQNLNIMSFYTKVIFPFVPETETDLFIRNMLLNNIYIDYYSQERQQRIIVEDIHLSVENFCSSTNYNSGKITNLSYKGTSGLPLPLQNLTTQFAITPNSLALNDCQLLTNHSRLQGDFKLSNKNKMAKLSNKKEELLFEATFNETTLSSIDLAHFLSSFQEINTCYKLHGAMSVASDCVIWENCKLSFGNLGSYVETTGCYRGKDKNTIKNISVTNGLLHTTDLLPYLEKETLIMPYLNKLTYILFNNAQLTGNAEKNNLTGQFSTNLGNVSTNLAIEYFDKEKDLMYNGKIELTDIAIHKILPSFPISSISALLQVKGRGYDIHSNTFSIHTVADRMEMTSSTYDYKNMTTSCSIDNRMMTFHLNSKDIHADLAIEGSYNFKQPNNLKIDGIIRKLHLEKIALTNYPLKISTKFSLNMDHVFDKFPVGQCTFDQTKIKKSKNELMVKELKINSLSSRTENLLTLTSPLIDCKLEGKFTINSFIKHLTHWIHKIKNQANNENIPDLVNVQYTIHCKNISPILNCFAQNIYVSPATTLVGYFIYDKEYHGSLKVTKSSDIYFKALKFEQAKVDLTIHHATNEKLRSVQLNCTSEKQNWHKKIETAMLSLQLEVSKNMFFISNKLTIPAYESSLFVEGSGSFTQDSIKIDLLPSNLTVKDQVWSIQTQRSSFVSKKEVAIGDLFITDGQGTIHIGGKLSESSKDNALYGKIHDIPIHYLSEVIKGPCQGTIDATLAVHHIKNILTTTGNIHVKECKVKDQSIGDFTAKVYWNELENKLALEGKLVHKGHTPLEAHGYYTLGGGKNNLSLTTTLNQMELDLVNPFVISIFSEIKGKLTGKFQLTGNHLHKLELNGKGNVDKGQLKIDFWNTLYQINGTIEAKKNILHIHSLQLHDSQSGYANLCGTLELVNGFPLSLSGKVSTLHLLNTTQIHNADFYGNLYGSGTLQIQGPIRNLVFKAKATTDKGDFSIITSNKDQIDNTTQLVRFVYKQPNNSKENDTSTDTKEENKDKLSIKLLLNLTILPTVKTTVLFGSYNSKDMIKGRGVGNIQLEIGTDRKPYLIGDYIFKKGSCAISVYNLIQKNFTIIPNSQVTFSGYPQEGIAHIRASYTQMASITELCPKSNDKRPIPAEISLYASGSLGNPHITYSVSFPVKSIDSELNNALEECTSKALLDKNYRGKQILSLLMAKKVYNTKEINGWDALSNSINDLLSQQIQDLVSKIDRNLEIETDLGIAQWNKRNLNLLEKTKIKVSYMLLGRNLRLSTALGQSSNLINDWEIAYLFSKMNNMTAKLYQHPLESGFSTLSLSGISLTYTKRFR
ncbi:translocation/assembly module TamB domain-containing protein [Cardinium endosymbiont of Culicoides punctatus]|uniref:translocation/assembly module TamB domain-containing protein n=1 Tax=Cardinium endosymbiont of Culicoides punctatus TaxID=2304601 RepID=UPI001059190E|nr:translocation/assembly module TamB domain-containing protein [Cardinium endosymbiont of Culicoides punctatus]TDG95636.1 hypothetical protein CCPUN_00900 [Cardinium endosymbiont of Culicoides punctatus]